MSGYMDRANAVAWHPGLDTLLLFLIASLRAGDNSGRPYVHPCAALWAVLASITFVSGFKTRLADSLAAPSGRHKKTRSA